MDHQGRATDHHGHLQRTELEIGYQSGAYRDSNATDTGNQVQHTRGNPPHRSVFQAQGKELQPSCHPYHYARKKLNQHVSLYLAVNFV